jgi:hypothetical protein
MKLILTILLSLTIQSSYAVEAVETCVFLAPTGKYIHCGPMDSGTYYQLLLDESHQIGDDLPDNYFGITTNCDSVENDKHGSLKACMEYFRIYKYMNPTKKENSKIIGTLEHILETLKEAQPSQQCQEADQCQG